MPAYKQQRNGSVAIDDGGVVWVSVFLHNTSPDRVAPVLLKHYNTVETARALVLRGDFETLGAARQSCRYFLDTGDELLDCIPECYHTADFERFMAMTPYGYNYIYKNGQWNLIGSAPSGVSYTPLMEKGLNG